MLGGARSLLRAQHLAPRVDEERDKANRSSYAYSFVEDGKQASQVAVLGRVFAVSPGNLTNPPRPALLHEEAVTAYRTVPATTRNLVPGALVMVMPFPAKHPASGLRPYQISWITGIVDRVDRELGFVYLVGRTEPAWISSTRVAVLSWRLGGKVTILGGLKRDQLAVSVGEVTLPD